MCTCTQVNSCTALAAPDQLAQRARSDQLPTLNTHACPPMRPPLCPPPPPRRVVPCRATCSCCNTTQTRSSCRRVWPSASPGCLSVAGRCPSCPPSSLTSSSAWTTSGSSSPTGSGVRGHGGVRVRGGFVGNSVLVTLLAQIHLPRVCCLCGSHPPWEPQSSVVPHMSCSLLQQLQ